MKPPMSASTAIASASSLGEREDGAACRAAQKDAPRRTDPLVLEGVLEEEADAERDGDDAEPVEPTAADERLEVAPRAPDRRRLRPRAAALAAPAAPGLRR